MDSEDVTVDWGANDDDELLTPAPRKDLATLSGAKSLLELASGPDRKASINNKSNMAGDDRDSDVVSLGGGDDDMDELQAYQTRTNLGGMPADEVKSAQSAKQQFSQRASQMASSNERPPSPPCSVNTYSVSPGPAINADIKNNGNFTSDITSNEHLANGKKQEESDSSSKLRSTSFSDPARPSSLTSTLPPPGTHGLPPKPVTAAFNVVPYVRPSHPSITSASTMAPLRDRDRDHDHRHHTSPRRGSRHYSPDHDLPPLASGWVVRTARDGSNDQYYFNTKTNQSTWDRKVATELAPSSPPRQPYYSSGRRSPERDDLRRDRASRRESSSARAAPPSLSYNDRHYSPPRSSDYYTAPAPVSRSDRSEPHRYQRGPSEFLSSHSNLRRGNDREISGYYHTQRTRPHDGRSPNDEAPSTRRDIDRTNERPRSPSRGRDRYERSNNRGSVKVSSRETRLKEHRPVSPGSYEDRDGNDRLEPSSRFRTAVSPSAGSQPLSSGAQRQRTKSPQRDDRYTVPSHETIRVRNLSPQASTYDRPPKRMRSSKSPGRFQDLALSLPHPLPGERTVQYNESKTRHYTGPSRDRPLHIQEPILIPSAKYLEREENQKRELEKNYDTKRQKTTDDLDSTSARRVMSGDLTSRDVRENDHPPRRFQQPQIDGPRDTPIGPRRRDSFQPRRETDSYRPESSAESRLRNDIYPERPPQGSDRDSEGSRLDLPTKPRAMDAPTNDVELDRRNLSYHRLSIDGPTSDSVSGPRGNVQPPSADNRYRHGGRGRPDGNFRDGGEGRYAPSGNSARYDTFPSTRSMPSGLSGPNTIPLKPRFGDTYRPDEQNRRDRLPLDDTKKVNDVAEPHRPFSDEASVAPRYPSIPRLSSAADRADTPPNYSIPKEKSPMQPSDSRFKDVGAQSSLPSMQGQVHNPRVDSQVAMAQNTDAMVVDIITGVSISTTAAMGLSVRSIEAEGNNAIFAPSPPPTGNARRKLGKKVSRSEQLIEDAPPRPVHNLPAKPSSLLDRLSNPRSATVRESPALHDRVVQDASPSTSTTISGNRPSLRDRLDSHPDVTERNSEDQFQRQGGNGGHNYWKNNRSRKGRGQL